ncbi:MAG: copper oxidase, partial [Moraxellaceae bacterium]
MNVLRGKFNLYLKLKLKLKSQPNWTKFILLTSILALMSACGGDSSSSDDPVSTPDPSALRAYSEAPLAEGIEDANKGAFEGGFKGNAEDTSAGNVLQAAAQREDGVFNVPTNGMPSPLFGADPFTQQMLRFEEFGSETLDLNQTDQPANWASMPAPATSQEIPNGAALEGFLNQDIWPIPTQFSNDNDLNPWQTEIESYLGRTLDDPPAEGRPPGLGWSHQRWDEFLPVKYFQTAQTGARVNGGFR